MTRNPIEHPRPPAGARSVPPWLFPFLLFLTLSALVAALNWHHGEQQVNYRAEYVAMAEYFRGNAPREVLTYPTWGYPFVLWLLPRYSWIVAVQVVLGAASMTWAYQRLRVELRAERWIVTAAFAAAVPWYALHSVKWPQSIAGSLLLLALLSLDNGLRRSRVLMGGIAGLLLGGVLYFRSEFLLAPLFLAAFYPVVSRRWLPRRELALFGLACFTAFLLLLPWAVHYKKQTGHYSLTASQKGIVAFISLGQLPGNPWGAEYSDEYAFAYLKNLGVKTPNYSELGDNLLFEEYKRRVAQHPGAFVKKVFWNGAMVLGKGFYNPEPRLDRDTNIEYESLRSALRRVDVGIVRQPASVGAWAAFLYWVAAKGIGALFVMLSMLGLLLWLVRRKPGSILLTLFAGVIVYQVLLQMLLAAEPRYLNGLYLYMVPFLAITLSTLRRRLPAG